MTAFEELVNIIIDFTPEQLCEFMSNPITELILQPEEASESYLLADSLCG